MPSFMSTCNCKGRRPEGIISNRHYSRPDLIARLLRERRVARFIVAPEGFGKSTLAFEYADVVFSFQHVFWVNGHSPCFLRDLDAEVLIKGLNDIDDNVRLMVFEDVPLLDDRRARLFAAAVDALLGQDVEAIITCTSSADSLAFLQRDRILLNGQDLLLSDDEMIAEEVSGRLRKGWDAPDAHVCRIACFRWGDQGARVLLSGLRHEDLPGDVRLAMLVLFVLGEGSIDDVKAFVAAERADEIMTILEEGYVFFGIETRTRTYRVLSVTAEELVGTFCPRIDDLVASSIHASRDALCNCLANMLLARKDAPGACALIQAFAVKRAGAVWLVRRGWDVLALESPLSFCALLEATRRGATGLGDALAAMQAWALTMLDDARASLVAVKRAFRSSSVSASTRMCAGVLLMHVGDHATTERVAAILENIASSSERSDKVPDDLEASEEPDVLSMIDWPCAMRIAFALEDSVFEAMQVCAREVSELPPFRGTSGSGAQESLHFADLHERMRCAALLLGASWVLDDVIVAQRTTSNALAGALGEESDMHGGADDVQRFTAWRTSPDLGDIIGFVTGCLEEEVLSTGSVSWFSLCAGMSLARLAEACPNLVEKQLDPTVTTAMRRAQTTLLEQQDERRRSLHARDEGQRAFRAVNPDAFRVDASSSPQGMLSYTGIPMLHVTLFGGIEVRIGENIIDQRVLNRQKAKALLAVLVLNHGREVPKDRLASILWAESSVELARKNLYSVWSQLKRALSLEDERGCPYLIRSQSGCRVDVRFVSSDVYTFEALCRSLLFGALDNDGWERLYAQVCEDYAEDLLPGETENEIIRSFRQRYCMQLVDSLIAASSRLCRQGESRGSLWFAREALRRDNAREDVYIALMEAQIASNQRGEALDTYFTCRHFLSEELGIDPSIRIMELYRSIIETEEAIRP